jgi:hypothetical protein
MRRWQSHYVAWIAVPTDTAVKPKDRRPRVCVSKSELSNGQATANVINDFQKFIKFVSCNGSLVLVHPHREAKKLLIGKHRRYPDVRSRSIGKNLGQSLIVIIVPMRCDDRPYWSHRIESQSLQIRDCYRLSFVEARVDDNPISIANMNDNTFAVVRTKNADLNLIWGWLPAGLHFRKGHYVAPLLLDRQI